MMPDVVGDAERAAGVPDVVPGSRPLLEQGVTELRFDLVPGELKLAGYQMWHRRRLAGMAPCVGDGLVFGYWDDVFSGYDVAAPCFRGIEMALLALECMVLRDIGVAHLFDAGRRNPERLACTEGPYAIVYQSFAGTMYFASRVGPGQPVRTFGGGLARRYQMEVARPGAAWSSRPVRERPEASTELEGFGMRSLVAEDVAGDPDLPEDYVPGARLDPPWTEWAERFASA
ncbi:MAG: hypothetical protein EOO23_02530 [Comamonadaceae bacterium]|nr:MAG: hypothetical protein EOO23_02530 [Comamonadaceae bacterium]